MKKLPLFFIFSILFTFVSCNLDNGEWDKYEDWRKINENWFVEQQNRIDDNGSKYYTTLSPDWDITQSVLIHYFNDRKLTEGNLSPLYTSTVDVKYKGYLYNGEPFDSSYTKTAAYGDSIYRVQCNQVIQGWIVALEDMRVGDSCEVVIPHSMAYGAQESGIIKPYSALRFHIKLVDIPFYETEKK